MNDDTAVARAVKLPTGEVVHLAGPDEHTAACGTTYVRSGSVFEPTDAQISHPECLAKTAGYAAGLDDGAAAHRRGPDPRPSNPTKTSMGCDQVTQQWLPTWHRTDLVNDLEKGAEALEYDANNLNRGNPADRPAVRQRKLAAAADVRAYAQRLRGDNAAALTVEEGRQAQTLADAARCEGILGDPMVPHRQFAQDDDEYGGLYLKAWAEDNKAKNDLVKQGHMVRVADGDQLPFFALTSYGGWTEALADLPEEKAASRTARAEHLKQEDRARTAAHEAVNLHHGGRHSWRHAIEESGLDSFREPDKWTQEKRRGNDPFAGDATIRTPEQQAHWDEIGRAEIEREQARAAAERSCDDVDGREP